MANNRLHNEGEFYEAAESRVEVEDPDDDARWERHRWRGGDLQEWHDAVKSRTRGWRRSNLDPRNPHVGYRASGFVEESTGDYRSWEVSPLDPRAPTVYDEDHAPNHRPDEYTVSTDADE